MSKPYAIAGVPATGNDASRYGVSSSPGGWDTTPASNVALCYSSLVDQLIASAPRLVPPSRTVRLLRARPTTDGRYELVERGAVSAVPTFEPRVPTKFAKVKSGGALIDELMRGEGEGFERATDDAIWNALRELCEQTRATGEEARRISDYVALAVLLRHGIPRTPDQLPL